MGRAHATSTRPARVGRAVAVSSTATLAALASHVAGGGSMPPALAVLAVLVLSWLPAIALIGRPQSRIGVAAVVVGSEFAFHAAFTLLASGGGGLRVGGSTMPGMPGMAASPSEPVVLVSLHTGPAMWIAHAVAAAVTAGLWLHGEAAVRALRRAAARHVRRAFPRAVAPLPVAANVAPVIRVEVGRASALLATWLRWRGPPVAAVRS